MTQTRYAVKGLSVSDHLPTGPFDTYEQAKDYLLRKTDGDHIKRHWGGDIKRWCAHMIYSFTVPEKSGALRYMGEKPYGACQTLPFYKCVDCGTEFPEIKNLEVFPPTVAIKCNDADINLCPWCRPDSKPWTNGRGV